MVLIASRSSYKKWIPVNLAFSFRIIFQLLAYYVVCNKNTLKLSKCGAIQKMQKIFWSKHKSSEQLLKQVKVKRELLERLKSL